MLTSSKHNTTQHTWRKLARQRRRQLGPAERKQAQRRITRALLKQDCIRRAQYIAVYLATGSELDLSAFMHTATKRGKHIFVPRIRGTQLDFIRWQKQTVLSKNRLGIAEPLLSTVKKPQFLDVVITPLVAFDDCAHRIGQGGGYYDRAFAWLAQRQHWCKPILIGAAFDCQRADEIIPNSWDLSLQRIITETTIYPEPPCNIG